MGCGASQPGSPEPQEEHQPLLHDRRPGGGDHQRWRAEAQRSPSSLPRSDSGPPPASPQRREKKTRVSPRSTHHNNVNGTVGADLTTEQMALAIAVAALNRERAGAGGVGEAEERRARALAAAMVAWAEGQAAQLMTPAAADDGREVGRPPRHNFCFKCGAALHSAATFCADCGVKLPREGDTESWREREARLKRERDEKERKEEEDRRRRAVSEFNSAGSNSSPAKLGGGGSSARPKPKVSKDMRGLSLLGETEAQFRKRQNLERQESQQSLYGLDAELKEKEQEKLSMAEYRKMVDDAMAWLEQILGDKGVGDFPDNLKSGRVLCALINKHWPGMIPQVGDRPIPLIERENIRFYLEACEKVGVRKQDLFVISDLYEEKYLTGVILNLYALAPIVQRQSSFTGPTLVRYA